MNLAKIVLPNSTQYQPTQMLLSMPEKNHDDGNIKAVQVWIEQHFTDPMTVDLLAKQHGMSVRTLTRNFKQVTQTTPMAYLQKVRLEVAKVQLATQDKGASEIIWDVGYEDVSSFRRLFKKRTGMTMESYRDSVNRTCQENALSWQS